ncbi:MAG: hypothetical protein IT169_14750 [Bryobacterales bacterium]|nr:hypothetical protein [Bryobacterales bacterium]
MRRIALIASQRGEFGGIHRRFGAGEAVRNSARYARSVRGGGVEWLLLADGQGARAAERACAAIPEPDRLFALGSIGYCGGTRPRWRRGDVMLASEVADWRSGERFPCWIPPDADGIAPTGRILTVERVIGAAEEKRRFGETGVDAVEMEASAVARFAGARGLRFFSLKAVSDLCEEDLVIDFNRATREDGSVRIASILAQALHRPWDRLPHLARLAGAAKLSSENLGNALAALFPANGDNGRDAHGDS